MRVSQSPPKRIKGIVHSRFHLYPISIHRTTQEHRSMRCSKWEELISLPMEIIRPAERGFNPPRNGDKSSWAICWNMARVWKQTAQWLFFNPKITLLSYIWCSGCFGYPQRVRRCSWLNGWLGISWRDSLWLSGEKLNVLSNLFKRIKIAGVLLIVYFLCHFIFLCFSLWIHYTPKNFLLKLCFWLILYILNDFLFFNSFY